MLNVAQYHVAYGQLLPNYSTIPISLNTVLRMAVGDFDFQEIYRLGPTQAVVLFWGNPRAADRSVSSSGDVGIPIHSSRVSPRAEPLQPISDQF